MPKRRASSWRAFDPEAAARPRTPERGRGPREPGDIRSPTGARDTVRILGLDPGSRRTGYGLVDCRAGDTAHVAHGCIVPCGRAQPARDAIERLRTIFEAVEQLIASYRPDEIAVERVFVNRNVDSALKLGQARGAALSAVPVGTPVFEYAPRAIKKAVVGFGGADKRQVIYMMRSLLALTGTLTADAADALAVAVCHAHARGASSIERAALGG
ncbi:MAG: crossover junction endodeoxyribonuclease RuvC, partial [Steroidobacteraceae bacterium]